MKKMKSLEDAKEAVESERDGLKATVASLKRDVDAARQAASSEQKKLDELAHERDILNKLRTQVCSWQLVGNVTAGLWAAGTADRSTAQELKEFVFSCNGMYAGGVLNALLLSMLLLLLLQADSATQKQVDLVRMTENTKRNLEQEVAAYR